METAAAEEIDRGGLRQLLLDDFHRCLKKSTHKTLRLFHSYTQARTAVNLDSLSMAAFHLRNADFLSEGWGVPQKPASVIATG